MEGSEKQLSLQKHMSYRLIQVIYAFFMIVVFLFGLVLASDYFPRKVVYDASINCAYKERTFTTESVGINLYSEYIGSWDDKKIRAICASDDDSHTLPFVPVKDRVTGGKVYISARSFDPILHDYLGFLPDDINYNHEFIYEDRGNWFEYLKTLGLTILIGGGIISVIRSSTLYIVFGKRFFS